MSALGALFGLLAAPLCIAPARAADPAPAAVHPVRPTGASQAVVVTTDGPGQSIARLTAYEWAGGDWVPALPAMRAEIGRRGFTDSPHEADGFTPTGEYSFTVVFGRMPNPGVTMPYRQATDDDHWVDDSASPLYNTWQTGPPGGRWASAETLSSYDLAAAFDFNQDPVVAGGNSAIFLHTGDGPTPGCIVMTPADVATVLRWLDPAAEPVIVLGVLATPPSHESLAAVAGREQGHPVAGRPPTVALTSDRPSSGGGWLGLAAIALLGLVAAGLPALRHHSHPGPFQ